MTEDFPPSNSSFDTVHVFSETDTATSYAGGVVHLSGGTCVTFVSGGVSVAACP